MARISHLAPQLGAFLGAAVMAASAALAGGAAPGAGAISAEDASRSEPVLQNLFQPVGFDASRVSPLPVRPEPISYAPTTKAEPDSPATVETLERVEAPEPVEAASVADERPTLAVIVDDIGLDEAAVRRLLAVNAPITFAILPYAEAAPRLAGDIREAGREVFLHLPMEPLGLEDPGPGAIIAGLDRDALSARLAWSFARVPGAVGFNNHMGSRLTADPDLMAGLFAALPAGLRDRVFVDSVTHPASRAEAAARAAGLASGRRDVFLDHAGSDPDLELGRAIALAVREGRAIAIGHPHPATIAALERLPARAEAAGVRLVPASRLVQSAAGSAETG